jgi:pilus assembly protein CpaF
MAGVGLPLRAVRSQIGAAVDAVVHVSRHAGGARRVEAIGELDAGADALDVRPLFERRGGALEPAGVPARPPRRADAPPLDREWLRC